MWPSWSSYRFFSSFHATPAGGLPPLHVDGPEPVAINNDRVGVKNARNTSAGSNTASINDQGTNRTERDNRVPPHGARNQANGARNIPTSNPSPRPQMTATGSDRPVAERRNACLKCNSTEHRVRDRPEVAHGEADRLWQECRRNQVRTITSEGARSSLSDKSVFS